MHSVSILNLKEMWAFFASEEMHRENTLETSALPR